MKKCALDFRLIGGFLLAHFLMFITFQEKAVFWYFFSATMLTLICIAVAMEQLDDKVSVGKYILYGVISGGLLFGLFWVGNQLIDLAHLSAIHKQVSALYKNYAPTQFWHFLFLMLVIVPGEEIFWRGFVQKRLLACTTSTKSIIIATLMYTSVHFYASHLMLAFAALVAGFVWSWLYAWKRSIPLVIVSHLIYDLLLFVILPLR
jgi:membrane protease YdiL (CAAX protease family)